MHLVLSLLLVQVIFIPKTLIITITLQLQSTNLEVREAKDEEKLDAIEQYGKINSRILAEQDNSKAIKVNIKSKLLEDFNGFYMW